MNNFRTVRATVTTFFAVLFYSVLCFAGRPMNTEDAAVVGNNTLEIELSFDAFDWQYGSLENLYLLYLNYGLTKRLQVSIDLPYLSFQSPFFNNRHGFSDIIISSKYLLLDENKKIPALSLLGAIKTKSGNAQKGLGTAKVAYGLFAAATKTCRRLAVHGMLGYTHTESLPDFLSFGAAMEYSMTNRLNISTEIIGDGFVKSSISPPIAFLLGMAFLVSNTAMLDAGVRHGLSRSAPDWHLTLGLTLTFK